MRALQGVLFVGLLIATQLALGAGRWPESSDPRLLAGREVWLGTCRDCHGNSLADAPQAKDPKAWAPRIAKGREVLYAHALEGFAGATGLEMPPRGGNAKLTDDEVKSAVDYMLFIVESTGP